MSDLIKRWRPRSEYKPAKYKHVLVAWRWKLECGDAETGSAWYPETSYAVFDEFFQGDSTTEKWEYFVPLDEIVEDPF
jgi:hypothetical protein